LDFVPAGDTGPAYGKRVSELDWSVIYERQGAGTFLEVLAENMRQNYEYVLIDSRTGLSDNAGVCTVALPDVLVNCFTLSSQSIDGAVSAACSVKALRADDIEILPVPMRVEDSETTKLEAGRDYARACFVEFLAPRDGQAQERYWGEVEVPYKPFYAYEEILATIGDRPHQENTLLASFERLTRVVSGGDVDELVPMPEPDRRRWLSDYERMKRPVASDVFVSHAEQDRMWAEWIAFQLESAGYRVLSQGTGLAPGADIEAEIERTVNAVACTVAVLTPDYVESAHARTAWDAAVARDPYGELGLLIPVKAMQFRPLGGFASRVPIEFVGLSADRAREELLAAMREPGIPAGGSRREGVDDSEEPRFPGDQPPVFEVPSRNLTFVGRDHLLLDLRARLATGSRAAVLPQALHGLGGVGKTQIALEYAHRFAADYDLVWWVNAEQVAEARASLTSLAPELGIAPGDDAAETLRSVLDALRRGDPYRRWLLVFDNADATVEIQQLLPHSMQPNDTGHILLTSRNQDWADVGDTVEVDVFTREESIQLLSRRGRAITLSEADQLADRLGDLPLAIEQAAVWQSETGMPVEEYLSLFDEQLNQLLSQGRPKHYTTSLAATWAIAFERLKEQSPAALQLLKLCAFFGAEPIPFWVLHMGRFAPSLPSPLDEAIVDTIYRRRAVREIGRFALARLDPGRDVLVVHRLVQDVLRDQMSEDEREQFRDSVHELMAAANPGNADNAQTWEQHAALSPHIIPTDVISSNTPQVRKVALDQIRYRYRRGDVLGSRELAEIARARWIELLGPNDEQTLLVSKYLADTLWWIGDLVGARELRQETFERMELVLPEDHELTLITANAYSADLTAAGLIEQAREHAELYLDKHRRVFGEDFPDTLRAANNLAEPLRLLGRYAEARDLDQDTLARRRRTLREMDSEMLSSITGLAHDLIGLGEYNEAQDLLDRHLPEFSAALGPHHYSLLRALRAHAVALRRAGHYDEGQKKADENLDQHREVFGDSHLDTLAAITSAASGRRMVDDLRGARELGEQAVEGYRRLLGSDHPFTFVSMSNMAIVLRALGDVPEAQALNEAALAGLERTLGPDHVFALCATGNLGNDLQAAGNHDEALGLFEALVPRSRTVRGEQHPYTLGCEVNLALDLRTSGEPAKANRLMVRVLRSLEQVLGADHPETRAAAEGVRTEFGIEPPSI
jgi:hypothetical protein